MPIKSVIFDLDGTITEPYFDFDAIRAEMGLDTKSATILEEMKGMSAEERDRAEMILHEHERRAVEESRLNEGARETLEKLRSANIRIGVLTRNTRENAVAVASKHELEFDIIVGREDGPVKPDAFGVLEICRQLEVAPGESLVVGDYLFDLLCAKSAGASAVLLVNSARSAEFVGEADYVISSIPEILEIIAKEK